jgi:purine-nucleoside phosphorylase
MVTRSAAVEAAGDTVAHWLGTRRPAVGIVLGSGLGSVADGLTESDQLGYDQIPGFPALGVAGHAGRLVVGRLGARLVICQSGRFHGYEGHAAEQLALPIRVLAGVGVRSLILTNAAGAIRRTLRPGTLMRIADHLNLTFRNPLLGPPLRGETRFPDMSMPYDVGMAGLADQVARADRIPLEAGVYAGLPGPSYETPAEIRMLARMGADAVGMSTVLEVIAARACGLKCLGLTALTNVAAGLGREPLSHEEVTRVAGRTADQLRRLLDSAVSGMED